MIKNKKKWFVLCIVSVMIMSLGGCNYPSTSSSTDGVASNKSVANYNSSADTVDENMTGENSSQDATKKRESKKVYTGYISLETQKFEDSYDKLHKLVQKYDGYLDSDNSGLNENSFSDMENYKYADMTARIPTEKFDSFINDISNDDSVVITDKNVSVDDISNEYYDTESRLKSARTQLNRLQELLKEASNVSDIIQIQKSISETEQAIDSLQGAMNGYDEEVNYSKISISIKEVTALSMSTKAASYGSKLSESFVKGFTGGLSVIGSVILALAGNWLILLVLGVIIFFSVKAILKADKKHHEKMRKLAGQKKQQPIKQHAEKSKDITSENKK